MSNMSNRWLFVFGAVQAIGAVFSILTFFGITFSAFKGHIGLLVISVILFVCSGISFNVLFRGRQNHTGTSIPGNLAPSTPSTSVLSPSPSTPTPIGVVPLATESVPVILNKDNPISTVRVGVGDYRDFLCEGDLKVRIAVKQIVANDPKKPLALLYVNAEGRIVHGGYETKRDSVNHYLVPQITDVFGHEEECSLFFYTVGNDGKYFRFFRAYVEHINTHAGQVVLNVFSIRTI
jgi:hypothetical protein